MQILFFELPLVLGIVSGLLFPVVLIFFSGNLVTEIAVGTWLMCSALLQILFWAEFYIKILAGSVINEKDDKNNFLQKFRIGRGHFSYGKVHK